MFAGGLRCSSRCQPADRRCRPCRGRVGRADDTASSMAAAVEQMSTSIDVIAEHASDAQQITSESETVSADSARTIEDAVGAMNRIAETVRQSSDAIAELGRESQAISGDRRRHQGNRRPDESPRAQRGHQAARAGEAGRASRWSPASPGSCRTDGKSTHEISEMIVRIQQGTKHAVDNGSPAPARIDHAACASPTGRSRRSTASGRLAASRTPCRAFQRHPRTEASPAPALPRAGEDRADDRAEQRQRPGRRHGRLKTLQTVAGRLQGCRALPDPETGRCAVTH